MAETRTGAVNLKGNPVDLAGPELKVGDGAPAFSLQAADLSDVTVVGGCWHDYDTEVQAVGIEPRESTAAPARFGTIGFRLCKRFSVPSEALTAAANDPNESTP